MDLIQIYECFCDQTRLRILNLLLQGPLCVCHFQEILDEPQVKISKHLLYLRARGMVEVERCGNWMIYALPVKRAPELEANLKCLQDCVQTHSVFARDLKALTKLQAKDPQIERESHAIMSGSNASKEFNESTVGGSNDDEAYPFVHDQFCLPFDVGGESTRGRGCARRRNSNRAPAARRPRRRQVRSL